MSRDLSPLIVGRAIAELGAPRVRAARRYHDAWCVVGGGHLPVEARSGRVPIVDLRHALELEERRTEALARVRAWKGRALFVLHGTKTGTGKTYSAIRWLLDGFDRGERVAWLACADWPHDSKSENGKSRQQAWLDRGRYARRVVIDDIGAGTTGGSKDREGNAQRPWTAEPMEGLLMDRISDGLSTLIISNSNAANMCLWLGSRVWSRIELGGRTSENMAEVLSGEDLRKPDTDVDEFERSPIWHEHAAILAAIGCERDGEGGLHVADGWSIGRALERDIATTARDVAIKNAARPGVDARKLELWKPCTRAIELLGLDRGAVMSRAKALLAAEQETAERLRRDLGVEVDPTEGLTFRQFAAGLVGKAKSGMDAERERREADLRARLDRLPALVDPRDVDTARTIATRAGLSLGGNPDVGYYIVGPDGILRRNIKTSDRGWLEAAGLA